MSWQTFPMITCPHCKKESQIDDYYDFQAGDEFECSYCEKIIFVKYIEWELTADIQAVIKPIKS